VFNLIKIHRSDCACVPPSPSNPAAHPNAAAAAPNLPAQALQHLEYPERLQRLLLTPEREVAVELAILRDNGEVATFNAYRVQHDNSRGPYKGGLRWVTPVQQCSSSTVH